MKNNRHKFVVIIALLAFLAAGALGQIERTVFVWDEAAPGNSFPHPDSSGGFLIRPKDAWIEAINALNADREGFAMKDTLLLVTSSDWPADLNPYDIVILSLGWNDGTGTPNLDSTKRAQIMEHLDRTARTPELQTSLIIEGNDFAYLYCDTASSHMPYIDPFSDYVGAVLKLNDGGPPGTLVGEDSSLAEGMGFSYAAAPGPNTSVDDVEMNRSGPYASHTNYLFNASRKCPARGIQRIIYSSGAVILLPFQFGNISRGVNCKEELLARMIDLCVMPIPQILHDFGGETFYIDSTYNIEFRAYDNRCVTTVIVEYSTDGGESWVLLESLAYPGTDSLLQYPFEIPATVSDSCYFRMTAHDSVYNFVADTAGPFAIEAASVSEAPGRPVERSISVFPNPFNFGAHISVSSPEPAELRIYDISGRMVESFPVRPPETRVNWDCRSAGGITVPAGVYLAHLSGSRVTRKLVFIK